MRRKRDWISDEVDHGVWIHIMFLNGENNSFITDIFKDMIIYEM